MQKLNKIIVLALLVGASTTFSAHSTELPKRGPIPFATYDIDGDGFISKNEFQTIRAQRRAARAANKRSTRNASNSSRFSKTDLNGNGQLSRDELAARQQAKKQRIGNGQGMGRRAGMGRNMPSFAEFDLNRDGVLIKDEFIEARGKRISERVKQGYQMRGLSNMQEFSAIDTDGNSLVTKAEFSAAQAQHTGQQTQMQQRGNGQGMGRRAGMGRNMPSFAEFDLNGDGALVKDEFIEARGRRISERVKQGYQMRGLSNM